MVGLYAFPIMNAISPIFACFAGNGGGQIRTILYVFITIGYAILALGCVNLVLVCITGNLRFKVVNFAWFAGYAAAVLLMRFDSEFFDSTPDRYALFVLLIMSVPIAVIWHFIHLLRARKRSHRG